MDPHERFFTKVINESSVNRPTSSHYFDLKKDRIQIEKLKDQFEPFMQELFGVSKKTFEEGYFKGTIFRFPFRTNDMYSELSQTIYNHEKIQALISSLTSNAHNNLLFLRNLESIEVYQRSSSCEELKKLLRVCISEPYLSLVRNKRREFTLNMIKQQDWTNFPAVSMTYPIGFDVTTQTETIESIAYLYWIVTLFYAGSQEAAAADMKSDVKYLPQVGVALPLDFDDIKSLCLTEPRGHIFCFLPLPLEQKSPTGLRVHVHGSFAIDQNRRHLKWPAADQDRSRLTDPDLIWNQFLVNNLLPSAMLKMIDYLLHIRSEMLPQLPIDLRCKFQQNKLKFEAYLIYAVIPEARILSDQWKGLAEAIIKTITGLALFYTVAKGGRWLNYDEAAFDNVESKSITDKLIRKLLKYAQYEMASIPRFIFEVLPQEKKRIVPNIVLDSYKQIQHTFALNDDERVSLLNYLLADTNIGPNLQGAILLPLSDKQTWIEFQAFNVSPTESIYIESEKHP